MATYGWPSPNWVANWVFYGFNFENNVGINFSMPGAGTITAVSFNCGTISGSGMNGTGGIWNQSGVLLGSGSTVALTNSGTHQGPFTWVNSTGMALAVTAGQALRMGWWRTPSSGAGDCIFGWGGGAATYLLGTTAGSVAIGAFGQDGSGSGQLGLYITYTPAAPSPPPPQPIFTNLPSNTTFVRELQEEGLLPS